MKNILLLTALLISVGPSALAQCKSVKTEIDKFSKQEHKTANVNVGRFGGNRWVLEFSQEAGKTQMVAYVAVSGEFNQTLGDDATFYFLLNNEKVVKLQNVIPAKPVTKIAGYTVYTTYRITLQFTPEELQELASSPLDEVKLEVPDQKIGSPTITKSDSKEIMNIFNCLKETAK